MDVRQRMGPPQAPGIGVSALDRGTAATRAAASTLRREFRAWVADLADPATADDLALAVYEALANVVDHAYASAAGPGEMRIWAAVSPPLTGGRDLVVTVSDDGAWRCCDDPGWRGRGLPLVRMLTHATVMTRPAGDAWPAGTTVQMRLRVAPDRELVGA